MTDQKLDDSMVGKFEYITSLMDPLRDSIIQNAIRALDPKPGSSGLDIGCGIGNQTLRLAQVVKPGGRVTGIDLSEEFISIAKKKAQESGYSGSVSYKKGDARDLPFSDNRFDWVWSADCVGYAPMELLPILIEIKRVIKPGGRLGLLAWSSEELLPGHPRLEARLSATASGIGPFVHGENPQNHFLRSLGWFQKAGLLENRACTFVGEVHAPLSEKARLGLEALFDMRWTGVENELSNDDLSEYKRIAEIDSPDFILNEPDYYAFFTYTMFIGNVPE